MEHVKCLRCSVCGYEASPAAVPYTCPRPHSGSPAPPANMSVVYDYAAVAQRLRASQAPPEWLGMWRYRALLPVPGDLDEAAAAAVAAGNTPLVPAPAVAKEVGAREVWVKDEGRNPSGSLKDRASALVALKARAEGRGVVSTASTGNAAAALAWACAALGQKCVIFVPATAPEAKRAQLLAYGARVVLVEGTYDDAFDLCLRACQRFGWYCRSTGHNPYTSEGKKTVALELCEQLARRHAAAAAAAAAPQGELVFEAPDVVVVSVGDGNIVAGVHAGLRDLVALGSVARMPAIVGVQAAGSSAIARAWQARSDPRAAWPVQRDCRTVADSIAAGEPRDPVRAYDAVAQTGGAFVTVDDDEILAAIPMLARATGVFAEPAAAAAYAGLRKAARQGLVPAGAVVVLISTGSGLKDVASAVRSVAGDTAQLLVRTPVGEMGPVERLAQSLQ
eukprot:m51a1_g14491 putative threonine synthase (449) ;mRNA; r:742392-744093